MFLRGKEGELLPPAWLASSTHSGSSLVPWLHVVTRAGKNSAGLPQGLCHRVESFADVCGSDQRRHFGPLPGTQ